jgi:hypothetical protein
MPVAMPNPQAQRLGLAKSVIFASTVLGTVAHGNSGVH